MITVNAVILAMFLGIVGGLFLGLYFGELIQKNKIEELRRRLSACRELNRRKKE